MDQQTSHMQTFQTVECVISERHTSRGRSQTKDTIQVLSPKQNIVYVKRPQQILTQVPIRTETTLVKPVIQQVQKVQVVDHREEVEFYKNKCLFYEKQISEMTIEINRHRSNPTVQEKITYIEDSHKVAELERQLSVYQNEISRLTMSFRETTTEIETLKIKNTQISQQLIYFQSQATDVERFKKTQIDNEQFYQNEIQRLNVLVQQSQTSLTQMQTTLIESKRYEQMYLQLQQTQSSLATELERCTLTLKQKQEEFDSMKQQFIKEIEISSNRIRDYEREIKDLRQREYSLQQQVERITRDYQDLSDRYNQDIRQKNDEISRLTSVTQTLQITLQDTSKFQEYEHRSKLQSEEIQLLNQKIRNKQDEIDKQKSQLSSMSIQLQEYSKFSDYESRYRSLQQELDRINNTLRLKIEENDHLRSCISKLQLTVGDKGKIEEYDNKIALLSQELERLHQSLRSRSDEIERLRQENYSLNNEISRLSQQDQKENQQQLTLLSGEIERLTIQLRNKNEEIEKTRINMSQFQYSESQKLKDLEQKNIIYSNEIDRLSNLVRVKINESEQYKQEFQKLRDQSVKYNQICSDNERLSQLLRNLQEELDSVKRKQKTEESQMYIEKIQLLTQELDSWKTQFIAQNREFHKNQELLILTQAELDSLKNKRSSAAIRTEQYYEVVSENRVDVKKTTHSSQQSQGYITNTLINRNA